MKRISPTWLLLALALVAGQWAAIAHSAEHLDQQPHDGLCVLCVQSHNLDDIEHSSPVFIEARFPALLTSVASASYVLISVAQAYAIRAPPTAIL